jgi:uncharacterized protein YdaU (DUF1376 family)
MPLYVGHYLADTGHLSTAEHGCYLLLIMHYWQNDGLPDDDVKLARICRCRLEDWRRHYREAMVPFFKPGWVHTRISTELARVAEISNKRKQAALQMHSKCIANADTSTLTLTKKEESKKEEDSCAPVVRARWPFEKFWEAYPKKKAKKAAEKAFRKVEREGEVTLDGLIAAISTITKDEQFIPYPASWLNAGGYLDGQPNAPTAAYLELQRKTEERRAERSSQNGSGIDHSEELLRESATVHEFPRRQNLSGD